MLKNLCGKKREKIYDIQHFGKTEADSKSKAVNKTKLDTPTPTEEPGPPRHSTEKTMGSNHSLFNEGENLIPPAPPIRQPPITKKIG